MKPLLLTLLLTISLPTRLHAQTQNTPLDTTRIISDIRQQFQQINQNLAKCDTVEKEVFGESSEGGVVTGYYNGKILQKITAIFYGEIGKSISEYYLKDNTLFFAFEKDIRYNHPIGNGDIKYTDATEARSYFYKNKLLTNKLTHSKTSTQEETTSEKQILKNVAHYKSILNN